MKTLIAIPCMDTVYTAFAENLLAMEKPPETSISFRTNSLVYDSRNLLSLTALNGGYDNVLWLDSDVIPPRDTLVRMQYHATTHDMVSGLYFKRTMPTSPVIYRRLEPPEPDGNGRFTNRIEDYTDYPRIESLFPVAGCGFGCVMTSTALLRTVWDKFGPPFTPFPWAGEDISFCYRVNQSGTQIFCDNSIRCGHVGLFSYTEQLYLRQAGDQNGQK